mgnify:CR=1 FL=1
MWLQLPNGIGDVVWSVSKWLYAFFFFFQAEDGIRDLVRSRGLGDVYKRQDHGNRIPVHRLCKGRVLRPDGPLGRPAGKGQDQRCLLYTSDAADDLLCVDLGGRRIIKKKTHATPDRGEHTTRKSRKILSNTVHIL